MIWQKYLTYVLVPYYNLKIAIYLLWSLIFHGKAALAVKRRESRPAVLSSVGVQSRFAQINGLKLHYVEIGDRKKPLMLFVHGFPEFWYSWRYQLKEFSKDYWCVALDQRGYGDSDKPEGLEPYQIPHLVSDIRELVQHLGRDKLTLVCHDWGAVVGFQYAMEHMDSIEQYILIGSPPGHIHRKLAQRQFKQFRMMWYMYLFMGPYIPEIAMRAFDMKVFEEMKSRYTTNEDLEAYKYTFRGEWAFTPPINYYRANVGTNIPRRKAPTTYQRGLLLLGDKDKFISPQAGPLASTIVDRLHFHLLENTDHFCQQSNPDEVNKCIRRFLKELPLT